MQQKQVDEALTVFKALLDQDFSKWSKALPGYKIQQVRPYKEVRRENAAIARKAAQESYHAYLRDIGSLIAEIEEASPGASDDDIAHAMRKGDIKTFFGATMTALHIQRIRRSYNDLP